MYASLIGFIMFLASLLLMALGSWFEDLSYREAFVASLAICFSAPVLYLVGFIAWTALLERSLA